MGRPFAITPRKKAMILEAANLGLPEDSCAAYAGVHYATLRRTLIIGEKHSNEWEDWTEAEREQHNYFDCTDCTFRELFDEMSSIQAQVEARALATIQAAIIGRAADDGEAPVAANPATGDPGSPGRLAMPAMSGNWQAAMKFLERKYKHWRPAPRDLNVRTPDGPIKHVHSLVPVVTPEVMTEVHEGRLELVPLPQLGTGTDGENGGVPTNGTKHERENIL